MWKLFVGGLYSGPVGENGNDNDEKWELEWGGIGEVEVLLLPRIQWTLDMNL